MPGATGIESLFFQAFSNLPLLPREKTYMILQVLHSKLFPSAWKINECCCTIMWLRSLRKAHIIMCLKEVDVNVLEDALITPDFSLPK